MKKLIVSFLAILIVLQIGDASLYAQRGNSQGPAVGQGGARTRIENPNRSNPRGPETRRPETDTRGNTKADAKRPDTTDAKRPDMKVANDIERNPQLSSRLQQLLPTGMTLADASAGFKNRGQFIAALHVSKNLNIPFDQMKAKMTGENSVSLGKAIHELRPDMTENQANAEAKKAEGQAKATENTKSTT